MHNLPKSRLVRYTVAVLTAGIGLGFSWAMPHLKANETSLMVLLSAVVVSTWMCGWRAGFLTTALVTAGYLALNIPTSQELAAATVHLTVFLGLALLTLSMAVFRQEAEESLETSETQLRAILENSLDPIAVSREGIHQYVNPAYLKMFGYQTAEELVGHSVLKVIAPDEQEAITRRINARMNGGTAESSYETRGLRSDGRQIEMEVHVSTYRLQGQLLSLVILRDVTERKQVFREKEQLIAELRGALSQVKTLSGLLPTCAGCRKIRDEEGEWQEMETYISEHSNAGFSHGLCPACAQRLYPEVFGDQPVPTATSR